MDISESGCRQAGRDILKSRGVDPDYAFAEGPYSPRLALVPIVARMPDSINYELYQQGKLIDTAIVIPAGGQQQASGDRAQVTQNSSGMDQFDIVFDCAVEVGESIGIAAGFIYTGTKLAGVSGWTTLSG